MLDSSRRDHELAQAPVELCAYLRVPGDRVADCAELEREVLTDVRSGIGHGLEQVVTDAQPRIPGEVADRRMLEQLVAELVAFRHDLLVVAERILEGLEAFVELTSGGVQRIVADLAENSLELADELIVDLLVDEVGEPPGAALADSLADLRFVLIQEVAAELHELIDEAAGVVARGEHIDECRDHGRGGEGIGRDE